MLDSFAQKILEAGAASGLPPVYKVPVDEARNRMRNGFIVKENITPIYKVEDVAIPCPNHSIGLRIYRPSKKKNLPCLIFLHGGGWTLNDLDTHDDLCRNLSNQISCVVVSVDFRRAPENKFPAPIEDSYTATGWVFNNHKQLGINAKKIGIGGDSSGGGQAAVVCLLARDRNEYKLKFQWLAYPVTDYYSPGASSYNEMADGYSLNRDFMIWFWDNYADKSENFDNEYLCPLRANSHSNLPQALIMIAHYDPLRDEGRSYAKKLENSGVFVIFKEYTNQMHGFLMQRRVIPSAQTAFEETVATLKSFFE